MNRKIKLGHLRILKLKLRKYTVVMLNKQSKIS